jgi:hypothetical protein
MGDGLTFGIDGAVHSLMGDGLTFGIDGAVHFHYFAVFTALNTDGSVKWTFDPNAPYMHDHAEGSDGTVYVVASGHDANIVLYALDGSDGSKKWQHTSSIIYKDIFTWKELAIRGSTVYLVCMSQVEAVSTLNQGESMWLTDFIHEDYFIGQSSAVGPDGIVLAAGMHSFNALRPENGTVKWTLEMERADAAQRVFSNDSVFVATFGKVITTQMDLLRLSGEDGRILWNISLNVAAEFHLTKHRPTLFMGCNGEVYVQGLEEDGVCNLRAFDSDGNTLRTLPCSDFQHSKRQNDDGTEEDIFVTHSGHFVIAYSGTSGQLLWNASVSEDVDGDQIFDNFGADGTVFVYHNDTAIAIHNGTEVWKSAQGAVKGDSTQSTVLMAKDGTAYLLFSKDPESPPSPWGIVAVDTNGTQKWSYFCPSPAPAPSSTPAPSAGVQIQSSVSALCIDLPGGDTSNGALLWTWECYGGDTQQWAFQDGQLVYLPDPSKCVDLLGGDTTNGNRLGLWDCYQGDSQLWGFDSDWGTIYLASSAASDATKCAQIGGENEGDPLVIWDCTTEPQQVWTVGALQSTLAVV